MPSTTSRVVSIALASSTVMTPSLPTFSMASAIKSPIVLSLLAAIVATWAISFLSLVALDRCFSPSPPAPPACSTPRFGPIGLAPAVTFLSPSRKIAGARTGAVVAPSPATSEVLAATSLIIWAPKFLLGSFSSTSLATVTPSLVMVGLPNFLSMTTFRPFGPSVTLTACDIVLMPRKSAARASSLNSNCLGMTTFLSSVRVMVDGGRAARSGADDAEDVLLLHDEVLLTVELDLAAGVLAEEDPIALLQGEGELLAVLGHSAGPDRDHFALLRLLLRGVGNDDAAVLVVLLLDPSDEHAVIERAQFRRRRLSRRAGRSAVRNRPQLRRGCLSHGTGASLVVRVGGARGWWNCPSGASVPLM